MKYITFVSYALIGLFLGISDVRVTQWSYWAIIVCVTVISVASYIAGQNDEEQRQNLIRRRNSVI